MATTVLVADDHPVLAAALSQALREWYHVLAPVTSLRLLPQAISITQPDVVLLDLSFGMECSLAQFPSLLQLAPATRYIIFTNHEEEAFAIASQRAGAHGFLRKTIEMDALRVAIDEVSAKAAPGGWKEFRPSGPKSRTVRPPSPSQELVRWLLASAYSHATIAALVGITVKGVEYHAARLRSEMTQHTPEPLGNGGEC